ncbi:glycoside hydrolase family 3 N-terminal domain-containing protein [Octadecabacter sp. 1_MG-2023]|uniref:glycoside hydrolase family 3 N-terminal domain-containing protein n=1 Tax=unclassified Octadecabacter TaxID=196158 RepID=UPI001C089DB1|nr:glycoside hydrolase family 3 N-terminal domain-containing protein [Octadecabacter sp. 1_MG-2023]MBU2993622.1 beta-hexosaminidase [Octadecabacter sp. B2R22]MDO6735534.1 glycoside hydrolase family 3 N-terminal domain-containing protein [Octadecabacter sp. 1_MG-2023]
MTFGAAIFGPEGPEITDWERAYFRDYKPFGFILFARNVENPDQLKRLCGDLREAAGHDAPILVDQEGGRVQRLRAPHWRQWLPPLEQMEQASDPMRAMWLRYRIIAEELRTVGIDSNCAPCADITARLTHPFLRNRCYGGDAVTVMDASRAVADAHLAGGVLPVVKHIPGHGRATVDSHKNLPTVTATREELDREDFAPFKALADLPLGMTAHIVFEDIDDSAPATTSRVMMDVIRHDIGFNGLLMTDDIGMEALSGDVAQRSSASIAAGCDVILHCCGDAAEIVQVGEAAGQMTDAAQARAEAALLMRKSPTPVDIDALSEEFDDLLN